MRDAQSSAPRKIREAPAYFHTHAGTRRPRSPSCALWYELELLEPAARPPNELRSRLNPTLRCPYAHTVRLPTPARPCASLRVPVETEVHRCTTIPSHACNRCSPTSPSTYPICTPTCSPLHPDAIHLADPHARGSSPMAPPTNMIYQ